MIDLNPEQAATVPRFVEWYRRFKSGDRSIPPGFVVLGPPGTGKTTLAGRLAAAAGIDPSRVSGGAHQASAASNLAKATGWDCRTLYRWVYRVQARVGGASWFEVHPDSPVRAFDLLVIDEISQVSLDLWNDTVAQRVPVLVLGDPGQLRPVDGASIVDHLQPDAVLTQIHRQAQGNPIIFWGEQVRQGWDIPLGEYKHADTGEVLLRKLPIQELTERDWREADAVLVHRRETRETVNALQRRRLGFTGSLPMKGERVVCRRNQTDHGLINSFAGTVIESAKDKGPTSYSMTFRVDETDMIVPDRTCSKEALGVPVSRPAPSFLRRGMSDMAFGYVHTVHAYIGRQAPHVLIVDEHPHGRGPDRARWLNTALSRGSHRVTIAVP